LCARTKSLASSSSQILRNSGVMSASASARNSRLQNEHPGRQKTTTGIAVTLTPFDLCLPIPVMDPGRSPGLPLVDHCSLSLWRQPQLLVHQGFSSTRRIARESPCLNR
jgi:hypothetical protein